MKRTKTRCKLKIVPLCQIHEVVETKSNSIKQSHLVKRNHPCIFMNFETKFPKLMMKMSSA